MEQSEDNHNELFISGHFLVELVLSLTIAFSKTKPKKCFWRPLKRGPTVYNKIRYIPLNKLEVKNLKTQRKEKAGTKVASEQSCSELL